MINGGKMYKNINDIRQISLETSFCALGCSIEFYMFVFYKIEMRRPELL